MTKPKRLGRKQEHRLKISVSARAYRALEEKAFRRDMTIEDYLAEMIDLAELGLN